MTKPARDSRPMSWLTAYCLDFGFCFDYPARHWFGYFDVLREYGYNVVWLWTAGVTPTPGFEQTLAWRCEYAAQVVDYLHSIGMRVHLMSGVFGWLGCSPGLIKMRPDIEITWPEELKRQYPPESTRLGICPTRGFDICLDYIESLYKACPAADGMALEVFCEKPHCQCAECAARGLWRIELDFLDQAARRLRAVNPDAEIVWNIGYERTHGSHPESLLYEETRKIRDPGLIWWLTRLDNGYTDSAGIRREWSDPAEIAACGRNTLCLAGKPSHFRAARLADALGVTTVGPSVRNLFLPEFDPRHFGYLVNGPPPEKPLYSHALFHAWALRNQSLARNPDMSADDFRRIAAERFFGGCRDADALAADLLLLYDLVVVRRVCVGRAGARVWGDLDGGDALEKASAERGQMERLRKIAGAAPVNSWAGDMRACAAALLG